MLPVAVDAMGGDDAPSAIVQGARQAAEELGVPVVLVGRPDEIDAAGGAGPLEVIEASEVIAMDADPASSVRRMKDSSLVRAAEAVRDGAASAMVSAGNTGATMASALLRMGRIRGVHRPAIATPIPVPGRTPTLLLDAGANAECQPEWLVQFGQMGATYSRLRYGHPSPRVGLLSIGEESSKGNSLVKATHPLIAAALSDRSDVEFVGNVEGRDIMNGSVDVVVTDGFVGNVALKTLEGAMRALVDAVLGAVTAVESPPGAADALLASLAPLYEQMDPEQTGGAMLLGTKGLCIISHGSSGPRAIVNAVRVAAELHGVGAVSAIAESVGSSAPRS